MKENTQILHRANTPPQHYGAVNPPVVRASLYGCQTCTEFLVIQQNMDHQPYYSRHFYPTVGVLERRITDLEKGLAVMD